MPVHSLKASPCLPNRERQNATSMTWPRAKLNGRSSSQVPGAIGSKKPWRMRQGASDLYILLKIKQANSHLPGSSKLPGRL
jgi:hypothetical protein